MMSPDRNILSYAPVRLPRRHAEHFTLQIVAWFLFIFTGLGILMYFYVSRFNF